MVGPPNRSLVPPSGQAVFAAGLGSLVEAAANACAARPELDTRHPAEFNARLAVAQIGHAAGYSAVQIADALAMDKQNVRRMCRLPLPRAYSRRRACGSRWSK